MPNNKELHSLAFTTRQRLQDFPRNLDFEGNPLIMKTYSFLSICYSRPTHIALGLHSFSKMYLSLIYCKATHRAMVKVEENYSSTLWF